MRNFPADVRTEMEAPQTAEVFLVLLTIAADGFALGRFVNNNEDVVSRGETFLAFPFELAMPTDDDERVPEATLRIDNIAGEVLDALRGLDTAPEVVLEMVRAADPDEILLAVPFLRLRQVSIDAAVLTGKLAIDNVLFQQYPADDYTPAEWRGLFS